MNEKAPGNLLFLRSGKKLKKDENTRGIAHHKSTLPGVNLSLSALSIFI